MKLKVFGALIVGCWCGMASRLTAEEKSPQEILSEMRRSGKFKLAEEYLKSWESTPAISAETRQSIPYEQGKTIFDKCVGITDVDQRIAELNRARDQFEEFLAKVPEHPLAHDAHSQLGLVAVTTGKALLEMSRHQTTPVASKNCWPTRRASLNRPSSGSTYW